MKMLLTHTCGCKIEYDIFGPRQRREQRIWAIENSICPNCRREQELEAAKKATTELGLPDLKGTTKQIEWASKLRVEMVKNVERACGNDEEKLALLDILCEINDAKFWIDHRDDIPSNLLAAAEELRHESEEVKNLAEVSQEKFMVRPEKANDVYLVKIEMLPDKANFLYEKDSDFLNVMHRHECEWIDRKWVKKVSRYTPCIEDLVAEIGADLLKNYFTVDFPTKETMEKVLSGDYEKECHRWIFRRGSGTYEGWFCICWPGKNDALYEASREIHGSRWDKPFVVVPPAKYREILDFADRYHFRLSEVAQEIVEQQKRKIENAIIENAKPKQEIEKEVKKSGAILEDLLDD